MQGFYTGVLDENKRSENGYNMGPLMFTCENAVFLLRLLPANFQRGVQDVSEAEVSNSARGCESNKQNPHRGIKQTA